MTLEEIKQKVREYETIPPNCKSLVIDLVELAYSVGGTNELREQNAKIDGALRLNNVQNIPKR